MGYSLTISSSHEDLLDVQQAIMAFIETYGDCEAKVYDKDVLIEEDGIVVHGEYGILDDLLSPLKDARLKKTESIEDARTLLNWNLVIFPIEND